MLAPSDSDGDCDNSSSEDTRKILSLFQPPQPTLLTTLSLTGGSEPRVCMVSEFINRQVTVPSF